LTEKAFVEYCALAYKAQRRTKRRKENISICTSRRRRATLILAAVAADLVALLHSQSAVGVVIVQVEGGKEIHEQTDSKVVSEAE
jgi:hypothetical protein